MTTVLYIDDNPMNRRLVERIIGLRGHLRLAEATTGKEGLDVARREAPAVILLDLKLPDLQGDQVLAALKGDPRTGQIPVVMLTAERDPEQLRRLQAAGAVDCLVKPFVVTELLTLMDELAPGPL